MDRYTAAEEGYKRGYEKGYEDGKKAAVKHGRKACANVPTKTVLTHQCMECGCYLLPLDDYCPNCGAMLDLEE